MSILDKWLAKRNIKKIEDLSPDEKETYDRYNAILSGENVSVDQIKEFCNSQVRLIQGKFADNPKIEDDTYLKACLHVYLNIIKAIEAPELDRKTLERHLNSLI